MARSLNKVQLIGNLTRDPELRYTPQGTAVCTFTIATNRQWTTEAGEKKEEADFHRIVAWNKLAEICSQLLKKGRKVYVEGRLQTRNWTTPDGQQRAATERVISDMIVLDRRGEAEEAGVEMPAAEMPQEELEGVPFPEEGAVPSSTDSSVASDSAQPTSNVSGNRQGEDKKGEDEEEPSEEDIPF